jgi:3-phosphoshikimate 1-carboxyvinyltransferase
MTRITIRRPDAPIRATIHLPRSKSISNRALIAASLAGDLSCLEFLSDADDTRILHGSLRDKPRVMDCGLGGTTFRFLLAWAAVQQGEEHLLTGHATLLERPHDDLIDALRKLGAVIERTTEGYRVKGVRLKGGTIAFDSPISSQYLSALMLVAPHMDKGLRIEWRGTQLSRPYVEMTAKVMRHFGAEVETVETVIDVRPGHYLPRPFEVQCDWSAAAFWYEVVALAQDAEVELMGLKRDGWQGDERVMTLLGPFVGSEVRDQGVFLSSQSIDHGCDPLPGFRLIDLAATPDLFQPTLSAFAGQLCPVTFTGLGTLRVKETDRIKAMVDSLFRLGHWISVTPDGNVDSENVAWSARSEGPFRVFGDHRMAMALAPLALVTGIITLEDPDVVSKSYPRYWEDLEEAGFGMEWSTD